MSKQPPQPASQTGMGAIFDGEKTSFRVWAPHADKVYVTGTFNDWAEKEIPLAAEENGIWSGDVPDVKPAAEYKYIIVNGEQTLSRNDPYARAVTNSAGKSVVFDNGFYWEDVHFQLPPWNALIIYEMHVGTFHNNNGKSDQPGGFNDVIEKLPYLQELGINAIEIMPPMEFPGGISWGYNPAFPFAVESDYGGPNGLKTLVKAAHQHGIAIILDVVYNHFGPSDLDLWQFDGWHENDGGGIYFYNDWRADTPWGHTRPDYGRAAVRQYIRDNALMWLTEYQIDGLRWDMTAFIRNVSGSDDNSEEDLPEGWNLMQWVNQEIYERFPATLTIAEDLQQNDWLTKAVDDGGAGFGSQWDAGFVHPIRQALITNSDENRDMAAIAQAIKYSYSHNPFSRIIYTESHDEVANGKARLPEDIWPGKADSWEAKKRSTLGAVMVFTAPGIPMLFQGQEFLEDEWFNDQDPLDWSRADTFGGIVNLYRDLIHLRRNFSDTTKGLLGPHIDIYHLNDEKKLMAFHRWEAGGPRDSTIVILNLANEPVENYPIGFPAAGTWQVRFNSDSQTYDAEFETFGSDSVQANEGEHDSLPCHGEISIGPYSALILSQDG